VLLPTYVIVTDSQSLSVFTASVHERTAGYPQNQHLAEFGGPPSSDQPEKTVILTMSLWLEWPEWCTPHMTILATPLSYLPRCCLRCRCWPCSCHIHSTA